MRSGRTTSREASSFSSPTCRTWVSSRRSTLPTTWRRSGTACARAEKRSPRWTARSARRVTMSRCLPRAGGWRGEKISILDWDVPHGNGTQEIFEEDPLTYFCSIHEHPTFCFPGTGRRMEKGRGEGYGTTLNLPVKPHTGDTEVLAVFEGDVIPEIERFRPDLIMISAGFDAHKDDPIADLLLTERSFVHMTQRICEMADKHCRGRIVSVLEGGYNESSLKSSAIAHPKALQGRSVPCTSAEG